MVRINKVSVRMDIMVMLIVSLYLLIVVMIPDC